MRPLVFNLGSTDSFAEEITSGLQAECGSIVHRSFPDGESYVRIRSECSERPVIVVCRLDRPDEKTIPMMFAASTLRDLGASQVGLIAPYLPYMRQDARFQPGEGVTTRYFAELLSERFDWLVTVDPHLHRVRSLSEIFDIPTQVVHAAPLLADWIDSHVSEPLLIGPDSESKQWVADVANRLQAPYLVLKKVRCGDRVVRVSIPNIDSYRNRVPVMVDDIISTGRTLAAAVQHLVDIGSLPPICAAVHAVFASGALRALREAGAAQVVTCNTIAHSTNSIDVSKALVAALVEFPSYAAQR